MPGSNFFRRSSITKSSYRAMRSSSWSMRRCSDKFHTSRDVVHASYGFGWRGIPLLFHARYFWGLIWRARTTLLLLTRCHARYFFTHFVIATATHAYAKFERQLFVTSPSRWITAGSEGFAGGRSRRMLNDFDRMTRCSSSHFLHRTVSASGLRSGLK